MKEERFIMQHQLIFRVILFVGLAALTTGCATLGYYSHLMNGHFDLMSGEQPIEELVGQEKIDKALREKLKQVLIIRQFAVSELGLPDNDSYKNFVKLKRKFPVWNVIAAEKYSVAAKQWCFFNCRLYQLPGLFQSSGGRGQGRGTQVGGL